MTGHTDGTAVENTLLWTTRARIGGDTYVSTVSARNAAAAFQTFLSTHGFDESQVAAAVVRYHSGRLANGR